MLTEIHLHGTHGTTVSRAVSIQGNGFKKGEGRLGKGIYFWRDSPYAEYLAKAWWEFFSSEARYKGDKDKNCAIIWADFRIKENEFLDLGDKGIKDHLSKICLRENIGFKSRESAATIICFVSKLEKKLGKTFKILESTIATPPKDFVKEYPISVIGNPSCYVVFDPACVTITRVAMC